MGFCISISCQNVPHQEPTYSGIFALPMVEASPREEIAGSVNAWGSLLLWDERRVVEP